nr:MAG TPA: hypothetical protein [Caudoviricetes sp.]
MCTKRGTHKKAEPVQCTTPFMCPWWTRSCHLS